MTKILLQRARLRLVDRKIRHPSAATSVTAMPRQVIGRPDEQEHELALQRFEDDGGPCEIDPQIAAEERAARRLRMLARATADVTLDAMAAGD